MKETIGFADEIGEFGTTFTTLRTKSIDHVTYNIMYRRGVMKNNYPVPAQRYITMITPHTVEIVTGIKKETHGKYQHFDCDCVFFTSNFPDLKV